MLFKILPNFQGLLCINKGIILNTSCVLPFSSAYACVPPSCATIFNSTNTIVNVHSSVGSQTTVDCVKKTLRKKGGAPFVVKRSSDSLLITVINDSITRSPDIAPSFAPVI